MSNRQFFKRRTIVILFIGILLGSLVPATIFVAAQSGTLTTPTISGGVIPGATDYTVFYDNSYYYYKDKFGAVTAGSTNASYIINTAITTANTAGGGTVLLSWIGTHTLSNQIVMKSNITLRGLNMFMTTLRAANALNVPIIKTAGSVTYYTGIVIENLALDGNQANQGVPSGYDACGICLFDVNNAVVRNCYIHDVRQYGIIIKNENGALGYTTGGEISGCVIDYCRWNGIQIGGSAATSRSNFFRVTGNTISNSSDVGATIFGNNNLMSNNNFYSCRGALGSGGANSGWACGVEFGSFNLISNNKYYNCDVGVGMISTDDENTIQGGEFDTCENCVGIDGSDFVVVDGIVATNCYRIVDNKAASNNTIVNCISRDCAIEAILFRTSGANNWVANNDFKGCNEDINDSVGSAASYGYNRWVNGTYSSGVP